MRAKLVEERGRLEPGEVGAEAEVRPDAERELRVRLPAEIEPVGVGEDGLVAVRRGVVEDDLVAGAHLPAFELDAAGRGAAEIQHGGDTAQERLDRERRQAGVSDQASPPSAPLNAPQET